MAEGIKIEIFKQKNADELTKALSDPDSRMETGGAAAVTAALAASLLERAAAITKKTAGENERVDYILRNAEILRGYMIHLIDEDVKSRHPLRRALREGGEQEIEAARQPAVAIPAEVINMMGQMLELAKELCALCPRDAVHWLGECAELAKELCALCPRDVGHFLGECAELAMAAIRSARLYILDMSDKCSDETYRFVVRRENEITLSACEACAAEIRKAAEEAV